MILVCLVSSIAGSTINKEIDLETEQKTALSNIGITDLIVKHNCIEGKGNCQATLFKQGSINKEIEIDTSETFCIKEELDEEFNEMVCTEYRGLTEEEINEKIRIATEDKLNQIAGVLIQRQHQEDPQDNTMEISIK